MDKKYYFWYKYYPYIITAVFLTLSIILITRHELWHDEIAAWNIGLESTSIQDFIANMRDSYGHPYLWNAILYFISHFITQNAESMKVVHLALSTASIFLFLKYAPFNRIVKALFVFGYFPFYEYSIISRNYAIGILPIIIFCILYRNKYKNIIAISITLFFMGQADIYTFIISMVLAIYIVIDFIIDRKIFVKSINKIHLAVAAAIVILGIIFIYWQLGSQAIHGNVFGPTIFTVFSKTFEQYKQSFYHIARGIISAFIPIPQITLDSWYANGNLITYFLSKFRLLYTFIFSIILLIIPIFVLKKKVITLYILGSTCILLFAFFIYGGSIRHFGHLFILLITCLWISNLYNKNYRYLVNYKGNQSKILLNTFLVVFLSLSIVGSSIMTYYDYRYPFTSGKQVAEYIEDNYDKDKIIIVGYKDVDARIVSAYLDKDIYLPQFGQFGRYVFRGIDRICDLGTDEIFGQAFSLINQGSKVLVVIHCNAIKDSRVPEKYLFKKVAVEFDNSIIGFEKPCLYIFDNLRNKPILDFTSYNNAELQNVKLSDDKREIIIEEGREKLKLCKIPVKISSYKDYLINFEIKRTKDLDNVIYFNFIGGGYENPEQEFILTPETIGEEYMQVVKVLNSNKVPDDTNIYFRIYTYSGGEGIIRNLEIYEIEYSI